MTVNAPVIPTTVDLLNDVKALISKEKLDGGECSDGRLAREMGWSRARVSSYMTRRTSLDNDACQTVAKALGWPLETVLACIALERAQRAEDDIVARAWARICQRVAVGVGPFFIGFFAVILSYR